MSVTHYLGVGVGEKVASDLSDGGQQKETDTGDQETKSERWNNSSWIDIVAPSSNMTNSVKLLEIQRDV